MAQEYSFDVSAKIDQQELKNALDAARKDVANRFDFKGAKVEILLEKDSIQLETPDEMKMTQVVDLLQTRLVKRNLNLKAFKFGAFEANFNGVIKCQAAMQNGLDSEQCKKITRLIKDSKIKVQARIQGDQVRVTGKARDDLQAVQKLIREANFDFATAFENYR